MPAPTNDFKKEFDDKRGKFMNGTIDEEEDVEKSAAIEADVKDMEKRKRVSLILNSDAFRQELEAIVESQLKNGPHPASLYALQHLADLLLPAAQSGKFGPSPKDSPAASAQSAAHVPAIADIKGADASGYSKGERFLRCKLAALFRLVTQKGWANGLEGHISARILGENETILLNPYGLQYHEVSASSLIKVDHHANIVHPGSTTFGVNPSGAVLHTAVHQSRPDVKCVVYLLQSDVQAVSALKCGLLPLSTEACTLGSVSYHSPASAGNDAGEAKDAVARDLGAVNKVMLLRNRGALVCGATIEETWQLTVSLVQAAQTQLRALQAAGGNPDNLNLVDDAAAQAAYDAAWAPTVAGGKQWKAGELEFESLMREFDNSGLRTGYIYKNPLIKAPTKSAKFDVEVPPASSSLGYFSDSEALRPTTGRRDRYIHAGGYERIEAEVLSDGDVPNSEMAMGGVAKVKWIRKDDVGSDPVKIDGPHQFTPVISGKKEMKAKIGTMKNDRDVNRTSAGYHSRILDGLSQNDQQRYQEATLDGVNQNVVAFSKGIIQKDFRKDAVLLTDYSNANPFDAVTDDEVENYRRAADRQARGLPAEEPPSPPAVATQPTPSEKKSSRDKKAAKRAQTLANPGGVQSSSPPVSPGAATDGEETGAESAHDRTGMTTENDTDMEGDKSKGNKAKKSKSFKSMFKKK